MKKILFAFKVNSALKTYLESKLNEQFQLLYAESSKEEDILPLLDNVEVIIGWRFTDEIFKQAKNLKLLINPGAGVQHIVEAFKDTLQAKGITLVNSHGNAYFTAQHTVALLLSLSNKILLHHQLLKTGNWRSGDKEGISIPLKNRSVGLLGYGAINQKVHRMLKVFGSPFSVCKYRKWEEKPDKSTCFSIQENELSAFLKNIDVLICAIPSTKENKNLINAENLQLLPSNALIVNVGRGDVIEEKALFDFLKINSTSGAAIDVWYNYRPEANEKGEKYPFSLPFHELENIVLSPHRAASPMNDLQRWDDVIDNINEFSKQNSSFKNIVSLEDGY